MAKFLGEALFDRSLPGVGRWKRRRWARWRIGPRAGLTADDGVGGAAEVVGGGEGRVAVEGLEEGGVPWWRPGRW
jgi:hypothetical protein